MHLTSDPDPDPMSVKPVLHVHTTAFVVVLWEQVALGSHLPLSTKQLSKLTEHIDEIYLSNSIQ